MTQSLSKEEITAAVEILAAVADTIKQLGSVPSGHVYAAVMGMLSLVEYNACINILERQGLVRRDPNFVLTWTGGQ